MRHVRIHLRQPRMREQPHRPVFPDETSTTTEMTRPRGRAPCGDRLPADAPFGHRGPRTFVAGLRRDELIAPWVIDGAMNRAIFETYVETRLAPCPVPGDVVILGTLAAPKPRTSQSPLGARGDWLPFLARHSPDLNPIETAFSKLKAHLPRLKARTFDGPLRAVGDICTTSIPTRAGTTSRPQDKPMI